MRALLVIFVGLLGIILGALLTGILSYFFAGLAGMSDFEGGRAMFAAFFMAPIGALAGLIAGSIFGWMLADDRFSASRGGIVGVLTICALGLIYVMFVLG